MRRPAECLHVLTCDAEAAKKSGPDSDDDEYWPGHGVERSTSSVLQTRSGNARGQSKGAKYRHAHLRKSTAGIPIPATGKHSLIRPYNDLIYSDQI